MRLYFVGQDSSDERSAVDLSDVSSLRHDDRLQLFDWIHRHHHLPSSFRVEAPETGQDAGSDTTDTKPEAVLWVLRHCSTRSIHVP